MTQSDYDVIDGDGKVTNYIWDDTQKKMVEGKREKNVPRWRIERIAQDLDGEVMYQIVVNSRGKVTKRVIISYEEEED